MKIQVCGSPALISDRSLSFSPEDHQMLLFHTHSRPILFHTNNRVVFESILSVTRAHVAAGDALLPIA